MTRKLRVLIDGDEMGTVIQDGKGRFQFTYDESYRKSPSAIPLSLSMPLARAEHDDRSIRPFMWGLLPENDDTLASWGRRFGVSPRNPFALLAEVGEDLQGAIQMVPIDRLAELKRREGATLLSPKALARAFAELMRDPGAVQFTPGGGQFSLAGAQRKKALYLVNRKWYEPRGRTPSTHILKPPIVGLAGQVENEMFCTRLAPRVGLPAPKCWTERFEDISVVVIERYDRIRLKGQKALPIDAAGGEVHRVHQEDSCQALRVDPRNKYQQDGGPGIKTIMELLSGSGRPGEDRDRFMRACAFNFVIRGTDAHGKNYGLLLSAGGRYRLAPLYDIASWLPYSQNHRDDRLAMSVGGYCHFDRILPRHWRAEVRKSGYDPDRSLMHIRDLLARVPEEARHLLADCEREGAATVELRKLTELIGEHCAVMRKTYGSERMAAGQDRLPGR
ncbi:MAG: type II toxin-antitoxin system HipA family toxin [Hyphomicrobiaceae bacterium]|nr:MAG: type II toxin-antitoxin system HipA family toxin [Hyphomicrobiaceae bacterium]